MLTKTETDGVQLFADSLIRAVYRAVNGRTPKSFTQLSQVMRDEAKKVFFGDEYKTEREALKARTIHSGYIMASIAASIIAKVEWNEGGN